jgi:predicted extracellular nuclease
MNFTSKLTVIGLSIILCSCGDKKKEETTEAKAKAKAKEQQAAITHESVQEAFVSNLEKMSETLATIKDIESARSAIPALTELGYKMKMLKTDRDKLGQPSKDVATRLEKKYGTRIATTKANIRMNMMLLAAENPKAYEMIGKVMKTIL